MHIDITQLIVVIVLAALAWYANQRLNPVPMMKNLVDVIIVVVGALLILKACGILSSGVSIGT